MTPFIVPSLEGKLSVRTRVWEKIKISPVAFSAVRSRRQAHEALLAGGGEFVSVDGAVVVGIDLRDVIGLRKVLRRNVRLRRSIPRRHPNRVTLFGRQNARRASGCRGTPERGGFV